jgi:hypothetical protein
MRGHYLLVVSDWGRRTYGQPCRECGYDWSLSEEGAVELVSEMPEILREAIRGKDVSKRHPDLSWSVLEYLCHVADNLRISAERLVGIAAGAPREISTYDQDLLAVARNYAAVPLEGALWSLERAVSDWKDAIKIASQAEVVLLHPERGDQTVRDVCLNNAHDANHHRWDIERTLR